MTDREILTQLRDKSTPVSTKKRLEEVLWTQYSRLVHKNWAILRKQMSNSAMILNQEDDFYSEAYIAFKKALAAIKLDKIKDNNWKFLGYYRLYLKNVRTAFIGKTVRLAAHETNLSMEDAGEDTLLSRAAFNHSDPSDAVLDPLALVIQREGELNCDRAIEQCMSIWDEKRQQIFLLRQQGVTKSNIARELQVHPATITYYLKGMKLDMEHALGVEKE